MSEKDLKPKEERLSKRNSICNLYADSIYRTNPSKDQLIEALLLVFDRGYVEGYADRSNDIRRQRDARKFKLNEDFLRFRDEIEDAIHKNR